MGEGGRGQTEDALGQHAWLEGVGAEGEGTAGTAGDQSARDELLRADMEQRLHQLEGMVRIKILMPFYRFFSLLFFVENFCCSCHHCAILKMHSYIFYWDVKVLCSKIYHIFPLQYAIDGLFVFPVCCIYPVCPNGPVYQLVHLPELEGLMGGVGGGGGGKSPSASLRQSVSHKVPAVPKTEEELRAEEQELEQYRQRRQAAKKKKEVAKAEKIARLKEEKQAVEEELEELRFTAAEAAELSSANTNAVAAAASAQTEQLLLKKLSKVKRKYEKKLQAAKEELEEMRDVSVLSASLPACLPACLSACLPACLPACLLYMARCIVGLTTLHQFAFMCA